MDSVAVGDETVEHASMEFAPFLIILAIFIVAILYSSVGHGGASGYLAVMALLAVAPEITRPTALLLNVFVASIGTIQFYRAGFFSWRIFLPFAVTSVPFAFIGGMIQLPTNVYKIILGVVLIFAALRLAWKFTSDTATEAPKIWLALIIGAIMGLLSGLVGVGGGIFHACIAFNELGGDETGGRNICDVHPGQFHRGPCRKLCTGG